MGDGCKKHACTQLFIRGSRASSSSSSSSNLPGQRLFHYFAGIMCVCESARLHLIRVTSFVCLFVFNLMLQYNYNTVPSL